MREGVTLCVPTIPPRSEMLARVVRCVGRQLRPFSDLSVAVDLERQGAAATRTRAVKGVDTRWTALLDDDDELRPEHLQVLIVAAMDAEADVVWPWFDVVGGTDPFPMHEGRQFDPADPHMFPITTLIRTEVLREALPFVEDESGEDWVMWLRLADAGARFLHVPERTWLWHHDSGNTSGRPDRW